MCQLRKNIISIFIAIIMAMSICTTLTLSASAESQTISEYWNFRDGQSSGIHVTLDSKGNLTLSARSGDGEMPYFDGIDGAPSPWDGCRSDIITVTIENGIKNVGGYAFYNCTNLQSISIPESVTNIGSGAFSGCTKLTNIKLPSKLETIYMGAFSGCTGLTSMLIPEKVSEISMWAFTECPNLKNISFNGDAPSVYAATAGWESEWGDWVETPSFEKDVTLLYISGKKGWTSPTWEGYKTSTGGGGTVTNAAAPVITLQPSDIIVSGSDKATLEVSASVSNGTLSYQWYRNTTNSTSGSTFINGANKKSYDAPTEGSVLFYYYCVVTNTDNTASGNKTASVTSNTAMVSVTPFFNTAIDGVAWSDSYFGLDPYTYNNDLHNLATFAAKLSVDAYSEDKIKSTLTKLGFDDAFKSEHYPEGTGGQSTVGYSFACKKDVSFAENKYNLIIVSVRGTPTTNEWYGNFDIGYGNTHNGFKLAEQELFDELNKFMVNSGLSDYTKNKILITGHSRGAAVANLLAARLNFSMNFCTRNNLFAFTFATPNVIKKNSITNANLYNNIYNFVNAEDFVPYLPLSAPGWDFWKYGRTYVFPSNGVGNFNSFKSSLNTKYSPAQGYVGYGDFGSVQEIINNVHGLASNVYGFYNNEYFTTQGNVSPEEYFQAVCDVMAGTSIVGGGTFLVNMRLFPNKYLYLTNFFLNTTKLQEAHDKNLYLAWMQVTKPADLKTNFVAYYARIACPVDVEIYDKQGILVGKVVNNVVDEAIDGGIGVFVDEFEDAKYVYMPDNTYTLKLSGTDTGTMTYTISEYELVEGIYGAEKTFKDVPIEDGKQMISNISGHEDIKDVKLYVTDQNGNIIGEIHENATAPMSFEDITQNDWFYNAVQYVFENKLFNGTSNTTFSPNGTMTRAMMVTVLYRMSDSPVSGTNTFTDVPVGTWYTDAVSWAAANKVVEGIGNNLFNPDADITREQMSTILYRYINYADIELDLTRLNSTFADSGNISTWAKNAVNYMYAAEIINGKGNNTFEPQGNATRAEVAQLFMNFIEKTQGLE